MPKRFSLGLKRFEKWFERTLNFMPPALPPASNGMIVFLSFGRYFSEMIIRPYVYDALINLHHDHMTYFGSINEITVNL